MPHANLTANMQRARKAFHDRLIKYFDSDVGEPVKKFWFISTMLDVRYKKLSFKNDRMITPLMSHKAQGRPVAHRRVQQALQGQVPCHWDGRTGSSTEDSSSPASSQAAQDECGIFLRRVR